MSSLGPVDYALLIADLSIEVVALVVLLKKKALSRHFTLVLFLCASIAIGLGRYAVLVANGFTSNTYLYFYFFSDALLIICLYFVMMSLYVHVFTDMNAGKTVRIGAVVLLAGTALISYYMVATSADRLVTKFVMEMAQNLYFVGVVLAYLLWGAMMKLNENRSRLTQLVLSMGVYFSAFAGSYALGNLYPDLVIWRYVSHLMVTWLPISWAYTFIKVSDADGDREGGCADPMTNPSIAALVFVVSFLALLQFFTLYCHSLIAKSRLFELSEHGRVISGITLQTVCGDQFRRLVQLIALCPEPGDDKYQLRAVSTYFGLLGLSRAVLGWALPAVEKWIELERSGCTYAAAVVLDRRIACSRMLMARQAIPVL